VLSGKRRLFMPEFFNVLPPGDALRLLLDRLEPHVEAERVATPGAVGRVTAGAIVSPEDLPAFPRSTMDGYSVRASDTFGASEGLPAYLDVVGEVPMGRPPGVSVSEGQAVLAHTGGMLADGADAVVMVEQTQRLGAAAIEVVRPVARGENVLQVGEDTRAGDPVLASGHVLRPQDVGGLLALGFAEVEVARKPVVSIVSTGDELVAPDAAPAPGQIRDVNTYTISALVESCGGVPNAVALVADDYDAQRSAAVEGLAGGDMLVFSAGSSVSSRDMTARVLSDLGTPGVLVHGISIKPGKPTIVALLDGKPAFGLPGNPVSAAVVFDLMVRPTVYALSGCAPAPRPPTLRARLSRDIASVAGREDYVQVRLAGQDGSLAAEPVFGKSNLIYTMVRADGVVKVPLDAGGLYAGDDVDVRVY
jgi:molybdopterin molybdotransferase